MREPDLQRTTLLGFTLFKIFENFETTFEYALSNFCVLVFHFRPMFSFYTRVYRYVIYGAPATTKSRVRFLKVFNTLE